MDNRQICRVVNFYIWRLVSMSYLKKLYIAVNLRQ
jgi:hypothetical protein